MSRQNYHKIGGRLHSMLYLPDADVSERVSAVIMQMSPDCLTSSLGEELAKCGYRVLMVDMEDREDDLEKMMHDMSSAVEYIHDMEDVDKIFLFCYAGDTTLGSAYQRVAENGPASLQGAELIAPFSDSTADFRPFDGIIFANSNWGNAAMTLFSLDPAVSDKTSALLLDSDMDLFLLKNGFSPRGAHYSEEFLTEFLKRQREINEYWISYAQERREKLESGQGLYADDEPLVIPSGAKSLHNNKLFPQDVSLMSHTRNPWPLMHPDGSVTNEIIRSVRSPKNMKRTTHVLGRALNSTVRTFLNSMAIHATEDYRITEDGVYGIQWESSFASPISNIGSIHVPVLFMGMTATWDYLAAENLYERSSSTDKEIIFIEGAEEDFCTSERVESWPGQYGSPEKLTYDYIAAWLEKHI